MTTKVHTQEYTDGETPLHDAVERGQLKTVQLLLKAGVDPNALDDNGRTPLYEAVRFLVNCGQDRVAVKITRALLKAGADPNTILSQGETVLHWAASTSYANIVRTLLNAGASYNMRDSTGKTPLHWAAGGKENVRSRATYDVVGQLLWKGANYNENDRYNHTPLWHAFKTSNEDVVSSLLNAGATITNGAQITNAELSGVLHNQAAFVKMLIQRSIRFEERIKQLEERIEDLHPTCEFP